MTSTEPRRKYGSMRFNPKLEKLLDEDELDWDNPSHREAYLKAWLTMPREQEEDPDEDDR